MNDVKETKYLTFNEPKEQEKADQCVVQVHNTDQDLPNTFLGTFVHEAGLDPFIGPRRDALNQHVYKLLREKYPDDAQQVNMESVTIEPAYELPTRQGEVVEETQPQPEKAEDKSKSTKNQNQKDKPKK